MAKEIITLQLGNYSNFVGSHFWNTQEASFVYDDNGKDPEVNNDILFREGITRQGHVTYTPRLVLADLKGGFGSVKLDGNLYNDEQEDFDFEEIGEECKEYVWSENNFSTHISEDFVKNKKKSADVIGKSNGFHEEEGEINWSDIIDTQLHPNSTVVVKEFLHDRTKQDFNLWSQGTELISHSVFEEFEEKIRFFAEESDCLQGFHILCDGDTGFGGLTSGILNHIKDEFFSKVTCVFPLQTPVLQSENYSSGFRNAVTSGLTLSSLYENCSMVCPLSLYNDFLPIKSSSREFPYLVYDIDNISHTSAILSSAVENITLNYRFRGNAALMGDYYNGFTPGQRKLLSAGFCLPFPLAHSFSRTQSLFTNLADSLVKTYEDKFPWTHLLPHVDESSGLIAQSLTVRGIEDNQLQPMFQPTDRKYSNNLIYKCNSAEDMFKVHLRNQHPCCKNLVNIASEPLKLHSKFPSIFDSQVQWDGKIGDKKNIMNNGFQLVSTANGGHSSNANGHSSNANGHSSNGNGYSSNRNGHSSNGNRHSSNRNGEAYQYNESSKLQNGDNSQNHSTRHAAQNGDANSSANMNTDLSVFKANYSSVQSVPVLSSVQCASSSCNYLKSARSILNSCRKTFHLEQHKIEAEEMINFVENLNSIFDLYEDDITGYSTESSGDEEN